MIKITQADLDMPLADYLKMESERFASRAAEYGWDSVTPSSDEKIAEKISYLKSFSFYKDIDLTTAVYVRDQLIGEYSDSYKDLFGFRPRHINWPLLNVFEIADLLNTLHESQK